MSEDAGVALFFLMVLGMLALVVAGGICLLVFVWRAMRAHERIANAVSRIAAMSGFRDLK